MLSNNNTTPLNSVEIQLGLQAAYRADAVRLYYAAFREKLHPIFRDEIKGRAVLETAVNPDYAITATVDGKVAGIAGFKDKNGSLIDLQPSHVTAQFGWVGGWIRLLLLALFARETEEGILLMDGIAVDADMRGGGIGSRLLDKVVEVARERGYKSVRLDVVDSNPRAKLLYERKGFVVVESKQYPWLRRIFGFSGATTMTKSITP